jgi:hypothetical protein
MAAWPDELYDDAAFDVGLACLELLTNQERWVHRRVETVDLLRRELVRRQVTVEFTLPEDLYDELRIGATGPWCVPIAVLRKQPLRHFDLREDGKPVPIMGQHQNGAVAAELATAAARLGLDLAHPSAQVVDLIHAVAKDSADDALAALSELVGLRKASSEASAILNDDTAGYFLATLAESYLLIALLPRPDGRRVLKYSYDDRIEFAFGGLPLRSQLAQRLGWTPILIDVSIPSATQGPSYHAEVVIPEELRVNAFVVDASSSRLLSTAVETSVDRASLHCPDVAANDEPVLLVGVFAERSGTPSVAAATSLVTTGVLAVGAVGANLNSATAGSSSAVLLAGSAIFAGVVARGTEHRLVRDVFLGARLMLAVVALSALAAVTSIAFGASEDTRSGVFGVAAAVSFLATMSLVIAFFGAKPLIGSGDSSE